MTYIDFEKLMRVRAIDPFTFPPIDIRESVGFMAEVVRDRTRKNAEAMAEVGCRMCRVDVERPSPRLRSLIAILGWLPVDPATDDRWYLEEPVELAADDNHSVAAFVAESYAENMNLLFGPGDGLFRGAAVEPFPAADATVPAMAAYQRLMAERAYVAAAVIYPRVPPTVLAHHASAAIARTNRGRRRLGLAEVGVPGRSTVGRWLPEIRSRMAGRPGIHGDWRCYQP